MASLIAILHEFPGEERLAIQFLCELKNPELKAQYMQFLREHDGERLALFELEEQLLSGKLPAEARATAQARLAALLESERLRVFWDAFSLLQPVRNCGAATDPLGPVRFQFRCPQVWESLEATDADGVRFCHGCNERVYFCNTREEVEARARNGDCISLSLRTQRGITAPLTEGATGRPNALALWANEVFPEDC
jgi:hypothetical protein